MIKLTVFKNRTVEINRARYDLMKEEDVAILFKNLIEKCRFTSQEIVLELQEPNGTFTVLDKWDGAPR